ncbi:hypothetical protein C0991_005679 [Blastosporella zonata]|nr:hypothetical protein C0991_005679 [Blastosporella zonata]
MDSPRESYLFFLRLFHSGLYFTESELNSAGLLGDELSLFTLECMELRAHHLKGPGSPTLSGKCAVSSNISALVLARDATAVSQYTPDEYERTSYYKGITGDGDHRELVYLSDFLTTPFSKPIGRHAHILVKSYREVFDTSLNGVCDTFGPKIRALRRHMSRCHPGSTSSEIAHEDALIIGRLYSLFRLILSYTSTSCKIRPG